MNVSVFFCASLCFCLCLSLPVSLSLFECVSPFSLSVSVSLLCVSVSVFSLVVQWTLQREATPTQQKWSESGLKGGMLLNCWGAYLLWNMSSRAQKSFEKCGHELTLLHTNFMQGGFSWEWLVFHQRVLVSFFLLPVPFFFLFLGWCAIFTTG